MPLGSKRSKFNYNLDEKRVLNFENVVNDDDNVSLRQSSSLCSFSCSNDSSNDCLKPKKLLNISTW